MRNLKRWLLIVLGGSCWAGAVNIFGPDGGISTLIAVGGVLSIMAAVNSHYQKIEDKEELQRRIDFAQGGSKDADDD